MAQSVSHGNKDSVPTYCSISFASKIMMTHLPKNLHRVIISQLRRIPCKGGSHFSERKKIKKLVKNKRNQNNNLAKNFLLTNSNLIAKK